MSVSFVIKAVLLPLLMSAAGFMASCQMLAPMSYPERSVRLHVVDEAGAAIEGVNAEVLFVGMSELPTVRRQGLTDHAGVFMATARPEKGMHVFLKKEGYYPFEAFRLTRQDQDLNVVLRPVIKPIPLYAKRLFVSAPGLAKKFAYDCERGDWVAPDGKGLTKDLLFEIRVLRENNPYTDYHYEITMAFANEGDGFMRFDMDNRSGLKGARMAQEEGSYEARRSVYRMRKPNQPTESNHQPDRGYVLRLRSLKDKSGKIISCHYAKAYGDLPDLTLYFNPTPNDRNLEFDPKKNLFENLDPLEEVHAP